MQLTNPPATRRQLWDWQANVSAGMTLLGSVGTPASGKGAEAKASWNQSVSQFNQYNAEHWIFPASPPSNRSESCVTFSYSPTGNQHSFLDAVWLKRYNGNSGGGDYYKWNNVTNQWEPHFENGLNPPFNYVNRVSSQYCQCP